MNNDNLSLNNNTLTNNNNNYTNNNNNNKEINLINNNNNFNINSNNNANINSNNNNNNIKKHEVLINKIKADGGAYKGCPKNDYCLHFVKSGERPQNFIRDYEEDKRFINYPKLNELIKLKNEILKKRATPPRWIQCDLKTFNLSALGKFDVILIDPPLEEYYRRAKNFGVDLTPYTPWTFEEISNLRIDQISETCCFLFLWVGAGEGLDKGRQLLKKWSFRRCEDIVWIKTNKMNFSKKTYQDDENSLLQHTKEHCLVGIKGAVKRGVDGHFIHANIDTDVIVGEEPPQGSTEKPEELYRIIERFCMGRKRIELFGDDRNKRPGWLTLGKNISSTNFNLDEYNNFFKGDLCYPEVEGYEGGRYVGSTQEIENLRPRSPPRNNNINVNNNNVVMNGNNGSVNVNSTGSTTQSISSINPQMNNINNNNINGLNGIGINIQNNLNGLPFINPLNYQIPNQNIMNMYSFPQNNALNTLINPLNLTNNSSNSNLCNNNNTATSNNNNNIK